MIDHAEALSVPLVLIPVPADQVVSGSPLTGVEVLGGLGEREYGVWEMSPGVMADVESDEVFVVVAGAGFIEFPDEDRRIELVVGTIVSLHNGSRTIWTVSQTLRKVWFA